jgi:hypothetical protein
MVYKRARAAPEPEDNSDEDSGMDSDEREALAAFKNEGFDESLSKVEEERKKKVSPLPQRVFMTPPHRVTSPYRRRLISSRLGRG